MNLFEALSTYEPFNEQEAVDKQVILDALANNSPACFDRTAQAHIACSVWTVSPDGGRTLAVYHNIYNSWSWIGGHADGEQDLPSVALRELKEETSVVGTLLPCGPGGIYSCEVLTVDGHIKKGAYVPSHLHLNVTYLAVADPRAPIGIKPDENSAVGWMPTEELFARSTEPWIKERIYRKLIDKLQAPSIQALLEA